MTPPPAACGLLLVAHGDGGEAPRDATVRGLADGLARRLPLPVAWATLKRPETFATAAEWLAAAGIGPADLLVLPLFMAGGWFVRNRLPVRLAEHGLAEATVLPALGLDPTMPALVVRRLAAIRAGLGDGAATARTVLVAHGSTSGDGSNRANAEAIAAVVAGAEGTAPALAFIEEAPFFDEVIGADGPEIVIGLFVSAGTHALDDVAERVARSSTVVAHLPTIGEEEGMLDLAAAAVERALARPGA